MNLYRLDFDNGEPVRGSHVGWIVGVVLCRAAKVAREVAGKVAREQDRAVVITRIGKAGRMRAMLVANPDGTYNRI